MKLHPVLVTIAFLFFLTGSESKAIALLDYIIIKGACYDYGTGPDIVSTIYAIVNNETKYVGASDIEGHFRVQVPVNSKYLVFKSKGFHDIEVPVQFIGHVSSEVEFSFILPTSSLDSAKIPIEDMLLLSNPKNLTEKYTVRLIKSKDCTVYLDRDLIVKGYRAAFIGIPDKPKLIEVLVKSNSNETIMNSTITTNRGLNFLIVDQAESVLRSAGSELKSDVVSLPFSRYLYFDQSSYNLTKNTKLTLDSVAEILIQFPSYTAKIKGYTDNLGEKEKNLTLSEFRARITAKYLERRGVNEKRLIKIWFGAENIISNTEAYRNRRVVVDLE